MGRTVLLQITTALALFTVGGIAEAATFTCTTSPCNGTTENDQITGTLEPETINGKGGDDQISALAANDKINGGTQNDTMHGGAGNDSYRFSDSSGADRIETDSFRGGHPGLLSDQHTRQHWRRRWH